MIDSKKVMIVCLFLLSAALSFSQTTDTIIDSRYTWPSLQKKFAEQYSDTSKYHFTSAEKQKITGLLNQQLVLLNMAYIGYDNRIHVGQLICHQSVATAVKQIFAELLQIRFPINQCKPISEFYFDDKKSMQANNTTCFDFRVKTGSREISKHAYGLAIDINPVQNPYKKGSDGLPDNTNESIATGRIRITEETGKNVIRIFKKHGWRWGGSWRSLKDYMHFEKG